MDQFGEPFLVSHCPGTSMGHLRTIIWEAFKVTHTLVNQGHVVGDID